MNAISDQTSDEELAEACVNRNDSAEARRLAESAFRALYDRHAKRLLAFLSGRINSASRDDVHQDVWAKVWQAAPTQFRCGNFRAWIHRIARNVVIDYQRKRNAEPLSDEANLIDHRKSKDHIVEAEHRDALVRCLQKLERANAKIADLVRSRATGESYDAYCSRTGMPADKAYRAFHQAKAQLQACVERVSP
jgi:RNA polymerase sigma factor (sigma-70 family)